MPNPIVNPQMLGKIEKATLHQLVFRWGVTALVVVLAGFGYWNWAWLALALAAFAAFVNIGLALVIGQVGQMGATVGSKP